MTTKWNTVFKPTFLTQLLGFSPKESHQVTAKVVQLIQNPLPDGKVRKQIKRKYSGETVYVLRSGNFRIRYILKKSCIDLLDVRRRSKHNYDENIEDDDFDEEDLSDLDLDAEDDTSSSQPDWEKLLAPREPEKRALPEPITEELLARLHVPREYFARLIRILTEEDLLDCPGVPQDHLLRIDQYMFELPLDQVVQQRDYELNDVYDLVRFKEGKLLTFLLKLSPEQEKFATWSATTSGPTLVKGGPGTGKSTVALYRIRSLIENLRKQGDPMPRILFTTYTNALVRSSEQQLQQLLGQDADYVVVQTADKIATEILSRTATPARIPKNYDTSKLFREAVAQAQFEGNALQQELQRRVLEQMGYEYLLEEIGKIIVARQIASLEEYLVAVRSGRKVRLIATQRKTIWHIYEKFLSLLQKSGVETWEQMRARAEAVVSKDCEFQIYDAVVVDEAQDLDPSVLRLLIKLCKSPDHLFITADANQSIYGSMFAWTDVHDCLKFRGRTSVLRANYRSTQEIGEAAQSYLATGLLDSEWVERIYVNNGDFPVVRSVQNNYDELELLAHFLPIAARECRQGLGSCAIFCPTENVGRAIASGLVSRGLEASFMSGRELDLSRRGVKVLTLKSSKGLEFPVVALAGFIDATYPVIASNTSEEEREEILARERRTMFVGMTRAMRALLVIVPAHVRNSLLQGFDTAYWNLGM